MVSNRHSRWRLLVSPRAAMLAAAAFCTCLEAFAQHPSAAAKRVSEAADASASVVMLSDLHFEPFQDPAKLPQLRKDPIDHWPAILNAPASATKDADFEALQKACPVRGVDTSWSILTTSIRQAGAVQPHPAFVTVSGDLLAHAFDCRFKALATGSTDADLTLFAEKTIAFVTGQLRAAFPDSPLYLALGNNDTSCTDYHEDRNSPFLQHVAESFAAAAHNEETGKAILHEFPDEGGYDIELPAPIQNARLIVLQDIFEAPKFKTCSGKPDARAAADQLAWLHAQLSGARARHQRVWVMAHMPPGVDMYSTVSGKRNVCSGQEPAMFLSSEELTNELTSFADVISLAIFAHSHADELRYLHAPGAPPGVGVPAKLVGSISPVNGNRPTFTIATVDPHTATLLDYTVFYTGEGKAPVKEYSFRETYKLPAFSAPALDTLTNGFLTDTTASAAPGKSYRQFLFPGDTGLHAVAVQLFWRSYACSLREDTPESFRTCACAATSGPLKP
jgi:sphingomyelin phosphodiesterase acid-like 3